VLEHEPDAVALRAGHVFADCPARGHGHDRRNRDAERNSGDGRDGYADRAAEHERQPVAR